jgi:hypothetical protein
VDFTREPIVETIITPREGFRLVIRSSKNPGQEEFVVDALEVVSFGSICFYRHSERPRSFLVPASDYELLEIREARMPLKAASFEGTVRQTAAKEPTKPQPKEAKMPPPKEAVATEVGEVVTEQPSEEEAEESAEPSEERIDRRKDRKRGNRRRRGQREEQPEVRSAEKPLPVTKIEPPSEILTPPVPLPVKEAPVVTKTFLPPPPTLIRDDLDRLRKSEQYRGAFYVRDEEPATKEEEEPVPVIPSHLQEEDTSTKPEEESVYKATPLPPEEEEVGPSLWMRGSSLGPDKL